MFHGCWLTCCAKLVRFICDLHVAASHLTFAYDPQRNNQITSIRDVVFPSGLTMLGLVSFPDLTLIFWVAMTHLLFVYSCHGVVFKIFVTLFTRTGSECRSSRIDEEETNFGHLTFLNLTLCVSVASYFEHSQTCGGWRGLAATDGVRVYGQ